MKKTILITNIILLIAYLAIGLLIFLKSYGNYDLQIIESTKRIHFICLSICYGIVLDCQLLYLIIKKAFKEVKRGH
ncbi:hypothetical protein ACVRWE_07425 [Streptococcus urinalis]|uniref:Uncharacterized protein n=1 Tax=Streptococcus urinalis 2285-97 TaxID=764291 RepID=G5KDI5_9STRE|nr:hypothetical protein [Streptococcus urinalis]EHJ57720.1 hypothetical protein STRUR_0629 [Streptococcus urinalis 2285-97]